MRFHQGVAFLETEQLLDLCQRVRRDGLRRHLRVGPHLLPEAAREPLPVLALRGRLADLDIPRPTGPTSWCLISAMAAVTKNVRFTTSVYIAPARDLYTRRQGGRHGGGDLEQPREPRRRCRLVQGGVRRHRPGVPQPGQAARRHDPRLGDASGTGRRGAEGAGSSTTGRSTTSRRMQMNPLPTAPIPIMVGGISDAAIRRMARLVRRLPRDRAVHRGRGAGRWWRKVAPRRSRPRAGATDRSRSSWRSATVDVDAFKRVEEAGVTDLLCAPWMFAARPDRAATTAPRSTPSSRRPRSSRPTIIAKMT